jgi:cysteine synthase A
MDIKDGFLGAVGDTPLIRLDCVSDETGCEILGKAEFLNPGGSVKDRAALYIVTDAEEKGLIAPGGTVVEGTAGNTGIGLVHICNVRGYQCIIYMPDNQSQEKVELLRTLGAEVRVVPTVPYRDEMNYQKQAGRFAATLENAIWANQFDNVANRRAHYETTGPEVWRQTDGTIDAFVASTGTGGTLAGVSRYLKEQSKDVKIVLADPAGSALYNYVKKGELETTEGPSLGEGIGSTRLTDNLADTEIDDAITIADPECVAMVYRLLYEDGLFMGGSTGVNVAAATRVAREMGPGHTIVTILADGGGKYMSRLFNRRWLAARGLTAP